MTTPDSAARLALLRRALNTEFEMSNRTTPPASGIEHSSAGHDEDWKTPRKEGYPDHSPRSSAIKWLKSEEAFLTFKTIFENIARGTTGASTNTSTGQTSHAAVHWLKTRESKSKLQRDSFLYSVSRRTKGEWNAAGFCFISLILSRH